MELPTRERAFYRACPLAEVICQVRFPPQLSLQDAAPVDFQRAMSGSYPLLETRESLGMPFAAFFEGGEGQRGAIRNVLYDFFDDERTVKVTLAPDFIAIATDRYDKWEVFRAHIEKAMETFLGIYEPRVFLRVGLRYQNVIRPAAYGLRRAKPQSLFVREMLGPVAALSQVTREHQSVTHIDIPDGGAANLRFAILPDADSKSIHYVLDCDVFSEQTEQASKHDAIGALERFHTQASHIFRWCIKERLHRALQPEPC